MIQPQRLTHLLETNSAPDADDRGAIRAELVPVRARLTDLEAKIAATQAVLNQLLKEQRQETEYANRLEGVLSPLRSIPDDILTEIFEHCCCSIYDRDGAILVADEFFPAQNSTDPLSCPWTLSQVCQNWRAVALSCARLWATVCMRDPTKYDSDNGDTVVAIKGACERMRLLLSRSKGADLRVFYNGHGREGASVDMFKVLCEHRDRWRWAHLQVSPLVIKALEGATLPSLTHLTLLLHSVCEELITIHTPNLLFMEQNRRYRSDLFDVTWDNIHTYSSVDSSMDSIEHLTNVTSLTIRDTTNLGFDQRRSPAPDTPVVLVKAVQLYIHEFDRISTESSLCAYVFDRFDFPCLRTLHLTFSEPLMPNMRTAALPSTLTDLTLRYVVDPRSETQKINWDDVEELWRHASGVSSMFLNFPAEIPVTEGLERLRKDRNLLPELTTLRLTYTPVLLSRLKDTLFSRRQSIKEVHLVLCQETRAAAGEQPESDGIPLTMLSTMVKAVMDNWQSEIQGLEMKFVCFIDEQTII
ncbi:hypothetical protein CYLTODRAFT_421711 [Cylindrobasidium torrendii FP15055 ss-10]|uniref:Uncharacterized protein n=1 Tax=Cylindrobasidium torrendii FP15055 ss-10 TaxID=1314674 RepID=A0A0D7BCS8_9AGAR|nr:hypothetical protein CYLTODRAFT_421711 [Cylindrobasidium torrendii FP15055 ss-10]